MNQFSLFMASRGRNESLRRCVASFFNKSIFPDRVEMIVVFDLDYLTQEFEQWANSLPKKFSVKCLKVRQSIWHQRDYNNRAARLTSGDYLWVLNDDCEMATQGWDVLMESKIEEKLRDNSSRMGRVLYVEMDDSTHPFNDADYGCCFPILTREAYEKLGCFFPPEIRMWSADLMLHKIFQALGGGRILLVPEVKVLHHSFHNETEPRDATYWSAHKASMSEPFKFTAEQVQAYANKLR